MEGLQQTLSDQKTKPDERRTSERQVGPSSVAINIQYCARPFTTRITIVSTWLALLSRSRVDRAQFRFGGRNSLRPHSTCNSRSIGEPAITGVFCMVSERSMQFFAGQKGKARDNEQTSLQSSCKRSPRSSCTVLYCVHSSPLAISWPAAITGPASLRFADAASYPNPQSPAPTAASIHA
jgi:hypothetical protein